MEPQTPPDYSDLVKHSNPLFPMDWGVVWVHLLMGLLILLAIFNLSVSMNIGSRLSDLIAMEQERKTFAERWMDSMGSLSADHRNLTTVMKNELDQMAGWHCYRGAEQCQKKK